MTRPSSRGIGFTSSTSPAHEILYHRVNQDDQDSPPKGPSTAAASPLLRGQQQPRDAAAAFLLRLGRSPDERVVVSAAESARVLRLIDYALLPPMLAIYFLQALDKATLSYASLFGLIEDSGLQGREYSWLGSIVYLAQLLVQLPLALALVKLPIGKFTSVMVLLWGVTLATMAGAHSFRSLLIARFFLGSFEAVVGPSFIAITSMWWRRREQTMRTSIWYAMNGATWIVSWCSHERRGGRDVDKNPVLNIAFSLEVS